MRTLPKIMSGVVTLGMTGALLLGATGTAFAAYNPSAPPYPVDPNNVASLTIFDATTGAVVRSGSNATSLNNYYFVSSTDFNPAHTKASMTGYLAEAGKDPGAWTPNIIGASTTYPATVAPAPVNGFTTPVAKGGTSSSFGSLAGTLPNLAPSTSDFFQLYQVRLTTTFPTPTSQSYAYADIAIDTTAGTWRQLAPTTSTAPLPPTAPAKPTATAGNTSVVVNVPPVNGATSYTVTSSPATAPVTGAGPAFSFTGLTNGTAYTFTATATNANGTSPASPASDPVTPTPAPGPASNTSLAVSGGPYTDTPYTFTATVSSTGAAGQVNAGKVDFFDGVSTTPLGTVTPGLNGQYVLANQTLTAGSHSIVARFTPTDPTAIAGSQSAAAGFSTQAPLTGACANAGSACTDQQTIRVDVPVGTLIINTPYTATSPLVLPAMTLNSTGTQLGSTASFANIKVTDTRSGGLPWTAKALAGNLSNGTAAPNGVINGQNVGLTGLTSSVSLGSLGTVTTTDTAAPATAVGPADPGAAGLGGTAKTLASKDIGSGTTTIQGTLTVNAPTSTAPGTYNGTIVFTVG